MNDPSARGVHTRAIGIFAGLKGYRASYDQAPLRASRAEAENDWRRHQENDWRRHQDKP